MHNSSGHDRPSSGHDRQSSWQDRPPWPWERPRPTVPPSAMRVSDAERAEVTALLCRHFADGRLDESEFNERQAQATAAKTRADLGPLLADLPRLDSQVPDRPGHERRRHVPWWILAAIVVALVAWSAVVSTISTARPHFGWLIVVVVVALVVTRHRRHPPS